MAPGARSKFGASMFEPEFPRKQMCCIEESTCVIVAPFWRPQWFGAPIAIRHPGNCAFLAPSLRPWLYVKKFIDTTFCYKSCSQIIHQRMRRTNQIPRLSGCKHLAMNFCRGKNCFSHSRGFSPKTWEACVRW